MAGRKPKSEETRKSAMFSARISSDLRAMIEAESARTGKPLSEIVSHRMTESYRHDQNLVVLIAHIAKAVEATTGKEWHKDAYTRDVLRFGIEAILQAFLTDSEVAVPERLVRRYAASPNSELLCRPDTQGEIIAHGVLYELGNDARISR